MKKISDKSLLTLLKKIVNNPNDGKNYFKLADLFLYGNGLKKNMYSAFYYYNKAAELGCVDAYHMTGWSYIMGYGTAINYKKAYKWFEKGALVDDPSCSVNYGMCLINGIGCKKDPKRAAAYLAAMASAGDSSAQLSLGECYLQKEMQNNYTMARFWFKEAAKQNHFQAFYNLGLMYEKGLGIVKDPNKALDYYQKAAKAGCPDAKKKIKQLTKIRRHN